MISILYQLEYLSHLLNIRFYQYWPNHFNIYFLYVLQSLTIYFDSFQLLPFWNPLINLNWSRFLPYAQFIHFPFLQTTQSRWLIPIQDYLLCLIPSTCFYDNSSDQVLNLSVANIHFRSSGSIILSILSCLLDLSQQPNTTSYFSQPSHWSHCHSNGQGMTLLVLMPLYSQCSK